MQVKKVLNIEDTVEKHVAVRRALQKCGVPFVDHADNASDGLDMVEAAIAEGKPYDLIVSDWFFPRSKGGPERESGNYVISELLAREINVPVIVCSSDRLLIQEAVGCIHYSPRNDLDADMMELVEKVRNM